MKRWPHFAFVCGHDTSATPPRMSIVTYPYSVLHSWPPLMRAKLCCSTESLADTWETEVKQCRHFGSNSMICLSLNPASSQALFNMANFSLSSWSTLQTPPGKWLSLSRSKAKIFLITCPPQNGKAWVLPVGIRIDSSVWCFNEPGV